MSRQRDVAIQRTAKEFFVVNRIRAVLSRVDPWALVLAAFFSAATVVGVSYDRDFTAAMISEAQGAAIGAVLMWVGVTAVLYVVLLALFRQLDRLDSRAPFEATGMRDASRRYFWPMWLTIMGGWLVWLIVHYPGSLDADTITQRVQWRGMHSRNDHHPWFDTAIFGGFWDLGRALGDDNIGLFIYLVLQQIVTAAGVAGGLCYLVRFGLRPRFRWALVAAAALLPVFTSAMAVMSKDTFATALWIPFVVLYTEALRTRGRVLMRPWIAVLMVTITIPLVLSKRQNLYFFIACALVLLLVVSWRRRAILGVATIGIVAVTAGLWTSVLLPMWGVNEPSRVDRYSLLVQQTARIALEHGDDIPADEVEAIDRVMRWEGLAEAYEPHLSDRVKGRWHDGAPRADKIEYLRVWLAQGLRYPQTAISATVANSYEYFAPLTPAMYWEEELNIDNFARWNAERADEPATPEDVFASISELGHPESLDGARDAMNKVGYKLTQMNPLTSKAFVASWLPLILLTAAIRRRNLFQALATTPFFVYLLFLILGPVALPRYHVTVVLASVFVAGLISICPRWQPRRDDPDEQPEREARSEAPTLAT